jgi:hypothetical protein
VTSTGEPLRVEVITQAHIYAVDHDIPAVAVQFLHLMDGPNYRSDHAVAVQQRALGRYPKHRNSYDFISVRDFAILVFLPQKLSRMEAAIQFRPR